MTTDPITPTPDPEPTPTFEQREETIGEIMKESTRRGIVTVVKIGAALVYLAMIAYAEAHGINMLTKGVNPDFLIWAYAGMIALGLTAILLPLAIHFWTFDPVQRITAYLFYAVDLVLLGVNTFTDYGANTGSQLTSWALLYRDYIMPATPVIAGIGWSILWLMDVESKQLAQRLTLRNSIIQKKANQVMKAANDPRYNVLVDAAAEHEVEQAMSDLFGVPVRTYTLDAPQDRPTGLLGRLAKGFFGLLHTAKRYAFTYKQSGSPD